MKKNLQTVTNSDKLKIAFQSPKNSVSGARKPTVKDELQNLRFGSAAATILPYENHRRKKFNNKANANTTRN